MSTTVTAIVATRLDGTTFDLPFATEVTLTEGDPVPGTIRVFVENTDPPRFDGSLPKTVGFVRNLLPVPGLIDSSGTSTFSDTWWAAPPADYLSSHSKRVFRVSFTWPDDVRIIQFPVPEPKDWGW